MTRALWQLVHSTDIIYMNNKISLRLNGNDLFSVDMAEFIIYFMRFPLNHILINHRMEDNFVLIQFAVTDVNVTIIQRRGDRIHTTML